MQFLSSLSPAIGHPASTAHRGAHQMGISHHVQHRPMTTHMRLNRAVAPSELRPSPQVSGAPSGCGRLRPAERDCELVTGRRADPPWTDPGSTVVAGLVPAISGGRVPRRMAGTSPAMTKKPLGLLSGPRTGRVAWPGLLSQPRRKNSWVSCQDHVPVVSRGRACCPSHDEKTAGSLVRATYRSCRKPLFRRGCQMRLAW